MRKLGIGMLATVALVMLLPIPAAQATGSQQKARHRTTLSADVQAFAPDCTFGSVHVQQDRKGWTVTVAERPEAKAPDGTCQAYFPSPSFAGSAKVGNRSFHMDRRLHHAELDAVIPASFFSGFHDLYQKTLMPVHVTWWGTGTRIVNPDGSVSRQAQAKGTIAFCGLSEEECTAHPDCTPPPCTNEDTQVLIAFTTSGTLERSRG